MALRYAVATGNWSNTATWNGGTLPTSADDVYANNFTVTIDQNITVLSLRNTAGSPAVAGGKFVVSSSFTLDITGTGIYCGTVTCLEITTTSPNTTTINSTDIISSSAGNAVGGILISGNGTININSNITQNQVTYFGFKISGNATINIVGNITMTGFNGSVFSISAVSATINWTGSMLSPSSIQAGNALFSGSTQSSFTTSTINIVGNLYGPALFYTTFWLISTNGILNITGNLYGGSINNDQVGIISMGSAAVVTINGSITAGSSGNPVIHTINTGGTSTFNFNGPIIHVNGYSPIFGRMKMYLNPSLPTQITYQTTSIGVNKTLYEPGVSLGNPAITDVRNGVTYASGSLTGTLIVPPSGSVALGVPVDDGTGTAMISITDMGALLASYIV
jgi:hypothetical protein